MNEKEFLQFVSKDSGCHQWQVKKVLDSFGNILSLAAKDGVDIYLRNFGKFIVKKRKGGVLKATTQGKEFKYDDYHVMTFTGATKIKQSLNEYSNKIREDESLSKEEVNA